jgi:hypothetical protein
VWHKRACAALVCVLFPLGACESALDPATGTGPYLALAESPKVSKVDLLFMIDNSSSMADKQTILATAVPELVDRLILPKCVDRSTGKIVGPAIGGGCAEGVLDFEPPKDIHLGIISSSLGGHGAPGVCDDAVDVSHGRSDPHNDDRGHLLARGTEGRTVPSFEGKGFLNYNPAVAGGLDSVDAVAAPFAEMVRGVGQHGCGYEASLEVLYRFLVDPDPYLTIRVDLSIGGFGQALLNGTDIALLQQRKDFLRPDSLVSIMIVTDENDCSVVDGGQGFYALLPPMPETGRSVLKPGTSKCNENPNDKCCFNCGVQLPPAGCGDTKDDPQCQKGELLVSEDQPNLRCFEQKRRYGVDFLYPVQRYIDGFTKTVVPNRKNQMVANPLFSDLSCTSGTACPGARDKGRVLVTGIVGVPWQDIAVDPNDPTAGYKTSAQLRDEDIWGNIVGDPMNPAGPVPPRDMHMVESIQPRPGLAGPESDRNADPIHGHEWEPAKDPAQPNADLQYACTFDLPSPKTCTEPLDCDCFGPQLDDVRNPICQNAAGEYTAQQLRAKAYPGTRILQVMQGIGDQAVLGSICAAQMVDPVRADFGYRPIVETMMARLRRPLSKRCLPDPLPIEPTTGQTSCSVIEVFTAASCNCDVEPGRRTAPDALLTPEMKRNGSCHCEMKQLSGAALTACRSQPDAAQIGDDGWCYVDPAQSAEASCDLVARCVDHKRRVRFVGSSTEPRPGATAILRCDTAPVTPPPNVCP